MRRLISAGVVALVVLGVVGTPAASAQQQISFAVGGFSPRSADARSSDDVLFNNLDFLAFKVSDFSGPLVSGEYLAALGNNFDAGLGVGFYQRTVPTVYNDFVNANGTEIEQDLKLRVVPFTATVRWLPMGHHNGIEPYIGAGVGVFNYRYSESGQFLATDGSIFGAKDGPNRAEFIGSGTAIGPVILGGVRVPVGSWGVGGELRYQAATGDLPIDQDFSGNKIDLGGFTYTFTINVRF
jgi:outer membrane protein W